MNAKQHSPGRWAGAWVLTVLICLLAGSGAWAARAAGPIITPTSWSDSLDDAQGLSWLERARRDDGQIVLSQAEPLGQDLVTLISLAEGSDGRFYLGGDNAHLWVYDPASDQALDLGAPVPDECDT